MKKIIILLIITFFCGCATNQFRENYNDEGLIIKQHNEEVKIIETTNLEGRVIFYANMGFVVVGSSHFEGEWEGRLKAVEMSQEIGATIVIITAKQTGSREQQYTLVVPQVNTTYHTGTINTTGYHYGNFNSSSYTTGNIGGTNFNATTYGNGSYSGTSSYNTTYSGTSTSISNSFISGSYEIGIFEQLAVFMAPKELISEKSI